MNSEIISIGDELLIGQVVNTNASWMANELNKWGIDVVQITAVGDNREAITKALDSAAQRAHLILITGGLGPTKDDITKKVLAEYFNSSFVFHEPTYEHISKLFAVRNYQMSEVNRKQAEIPDKCIPLENINGTAPGMWFEKDGKVFVSMPGVPFEMKTILIEQVIPRVRKQYKMGFILHKTIMTLGIGESMLAEKISAWEDSLPQHIKLAYLPQPGMVRLRLTGKGNDKEKLETEIEDLTSQLQQIIPELIYGFDDISLEETIGKLLTAKGKTLSTAESCTGGYIAHLLTTVIGSSNYFAGSIISYSNQVKINQLGVSEAYLQTYGAVSQQVVEQMALGGRDRLKTDYCLSVSGIAGPDGGTAEKPVGTVWIGLASEKGVKSQLFHLSEHRGRNIRRSALAALNMLRNELI